MASNDRDEKDKLDWNVYWSKKGKSVNLLYDGIAKFYRYFIIQPYLKHFIRLNFKKDDQVLHAGCGSGQVDFGISDYVNITALDISPEALNIYKGLHKDAIVVNASIFDLPYEDNHFDGIYNLGVMEHFKEDEIQLILKEFKRILKPNGKIVLFWPPTFGVTVNVLDFAHFILNNLLKMNIQLHPEEITRIRSKKHAIRIIEESGFHMENYYFGIRDLFTQVVITASKKN
ncbi:MAG: class I SAM-dependent methyltransferase [Vicingus serpentipes]|nr:class I SAM-dependent methyltransferase [Vicingus serpentipes]